MLGRRYDLDVGTWTLRETEERGSLFFECRRCRRKVRAYGEVLSRFRKDQPVKEVQARLRCQKYGTSRPDALVRLNFGRGDAAWWPVPPRLSR
jgi:hypothetical protein